MHIVKYEIIAANDAKGLEIMVQDKIEEGYTPYGSPFLTTSTENHLVISGGQYPTTQNYQIYHQVCQAVVKYSS